MAKTIDVSYVIRHLFTVPSIYKNVLKIVCCVLYLIYSGWVLKHYSYNRQWIDLFHICDSIIVFLYQIICDLILQKKVTKCIATITEIDRRFNSYFNCDVGKSYERCRRIVLIMLILCTSLIYGLPLLHYFALNYTLDLVSIGEMLVYRICLGTVFYQLQFLVMIALIKQRYGWLNFRLQKSHKRVLFAAKIGTFKKYLKKIQQIHWQLSKVTKEVNYAYSFHLFYVLLEAFCLSAAVILFFVQEYYNGFRYSSKFFAVFLFLRSLFALTQVFAIIFVCSSTSAESKNIGFLLLRRCQREETDVKIQANHFWLQLIHDRIEFHACGFFKLNQAVIISIIASLALYIPLIITFNLLSEHSKFNW